MSKIREDEIESIIKEKIDNFDLSKDIFEKKKWR